MESQTIGSFSILRQSAKCTCQPILKTARSCWKLFCAALLFKVLKQVSWQFSCGVSALESAIAYDTFPYCARWKFHPQNITLLAVISNFLRYKFILCNTSVLFPCHWNQSEYNNQTFLIFPSEKGLQLVRLWPVFTELKSTYSKWIPICYFLLNPSYG